MEKPSQKEELILIRTIKNHANLKKSQIFKLPDMFALSWSRHGTDNCWATKCGCKMKGPSLEKLKQKRNSR